MDDYPRTLMEVERRFASEEACRAYLTRLRWPEGVRGLRCHSPSVWATARGLSHGPVCGFQRSVLAGTIFQETKAERRLWCRAMGDVTKQPSGVRARGLQRPLGWGSDQTAWTGWQQLRPARGRPGRARLTEAVEVEELDVGGVEPGRRGGRQRRHPKALVAVAAEVRDRGIGRLRLQRRPDASGPSLGSFVREAVAPGAGVMPEGWTASPGVARAGSTPRPGVVSGSGQPASTLLPRVPRVAALLTRWLWGMHQGAVSHEHLDGDLDECTFRFNRRTSRWRGTRFYRLVQQAVQGPPAQQRPTRKAAVPA